MGEEEEEKETQKEQEQKGSEEINPEVRSEILCTVFCQKVDDVQNSLVAASLVELDSSEQSPPTA